MAVVVDTNVPKTANGDATAQASPACIRACVAAVSRVQRGEVLVLDSGWRILNEYKGQLRSSGQPGAGDAFLKWVLTNWTNPQRCFLVALTDVAAPQLFAEFPDDPALAAFDPSDHKFVAVALAHPEQPPILNATDTDWWHFQARLAVYGVTVDFLCPDAL
ncbi:MAG: hypothetical protein HY328_19690 [Chloroflexi bacterium]|nr:hypothetical protein [Chloroflexota bacterium]